MGYPAHSRPPRAFCRQCGKDMGRRWNDSPICAECVTPGDCICADSTWNPDCEVHDHDPYDIPY